MTITVRLGHTPETATVHEEPGRFARWVLNHEPRTYHVVRDPLGDWWEIEDERAHRLVSLRVLWALEEKRNAHRRTACIF